ncbi:MAG: PilN domain-containing protein [Pyrinomonadaceae bacterium]|nr:PilN domain-containing protein [Pyrinomonadaceae bacterium]
MIKINLLDSVTDRQTGAVTAVDKKVSNPMSKLILMAIAVFALTVALIGWDIISTSMAKAEAEKELANQQEIAKQLEAVMKEQKELEQKIANIDARIGAIKKLRASQAGPSAVLEALRERIGMTPGIYLESVDQKGDQLTIRGSSPDESAVTRFGSSLEFSGGLFSNLGIETQRKDMPGATPVANDPNAQLPQIVNFTIKCAYTPSKSGGANNQTTAGNNPPNGQPAPNGAPQPAAANQPPAANQPAPQVAKN